MTPERAEMRLTRSSPDNPLPLPWNRFAVPSYRLLTEDLPRGGGGAHHNILPNQRIQRLRTQLYSRSPVCTTRPPPPVWEVIVLSRKLTSDVAGRAASDSWQERRKLWCLCRRLELAPPPSFAAVHAPLPWRRWKFETGGSSWVALPAAAGTEQLTGRAPDTPWASAPLPPPTSRSRIGSQHLAASKPKSEAFWIGRQTEERARLKSAQGCRWRPMAQGRVCSGW